MTYLVAMMVLVVAFVSACGHRPSDPGTYLYFINSSGADVLVRVVWTQNGMDGIPDLVLRAPADRGVWIDEPRTGRGPDAIEILDEYCMIVSSLRLAERSPTGGVVLDGAMQLVLTQASPPPGMGAGEASPNCPNR